MFARVQPGEDSSNSVSLKSQDCEARFAWPKRFEEVLRGFIVRREFRASQIIAPRLL
jgi:hypothetical protein